MNRLGIGRVLLLRWQGAVDGSGPSAKKMGDQAHADGARFVLLDFTRAPFIDTAGLRWLLALKCDMEERGFGLRLAAKRGGKVWRNVALLDVGLDMYGSVGAAWNAPWRLREEIGEGTDTFPEREG